MKRFVSFLSVALMVLGLAINVVPVSAADSSSGLSITPRKNYTIKPGESITDKLNIGNLDPKADLSLSLKMIDFTYTDQTGTPKLMVGANLETTAWSLKPYTTLPKLVTVEHGKSTTVDYSIKIPANLGAGSYYSAIMYQAANPGGGNVALNASGVTLVFVSVPGNVNEKMTVQKLGAFVTTNNGDTGGYVYIATNGTPKMISYALKNDGNVAESPAGNLVLKDMFGHQIKTIGPANETSKLALIGQTRRFSTCIKTKVQSLEEQGGTTKSTECVDPKLMPGRYTVALDVFYGQNGNQTHEITATAAFWVLPWWFLASIVLIIGAATFGIWKLQRKIRSAVKGTSYKANKGITRRKR